MPFHFTKLTIEAGAWCKSCNGETMHRVSDGRLGSCLECEARRAAQPAEPKPLEPSQLSLF